MLCLAALFSFSSLPACIEILEIFAAAPLEGVTTQPTAFLRRPPAGAAAVAAGTAVAAGAAALAGQSPAQSRAESEKRGREEVVNSVPWMQWLDSTEPAAPAAAFQMGPRR